MKTILAIVTPEECPILSNQEFLKKFPHAKYVAGEIKGGAEIVKDILGEEFPPFDELGVTNISDYLKKLQERNPVAIGSYHPYAHGLGFQ